MNMPCLQGEIQASIFLGTLCFSNDKVIVLKSLFS